MCGLMWHESIRLVCRLPALHQSILWGCKHYFDAPHQSNHGRASTVHTRSSIRNRRLSSSLFWLTRAAWTTAPLVVDAAKIVQKPSGLLSWLREWVSERGRIKSSASPVHWGQTAVDAARMYTHSWTTRHDTTHLCSKPTEDNNRQSTETHYIK